MGFWEGERCEYCGGLIVERRVELLKRVGRRRVLFRQVPAGVCQECGTRYYAGPTLRALEEKARQASRARTEIRVPVLIF